MGAGGQAVEGAVVNVLGGPDALCDNKRKRIECHWPPVLNVPTTLHACSKYVDTTLEHCRRNFKTLVTLPAINQVQTLCKVGVWVGGL